MNAVIQGQSRLSDSIEVRDLGPKGRGVVARRTIRPGEAILSCMPYEAVLYTDHVPRRCECCFAPCDEPLRCSRTRFAHYKDRDHQRRGWGQGYSTESKAIVTIVPRVLPPTVRLAARVLWKRRRALAMSAAEDSSEELGGGLCGSYEGIEALSSHWDALPSERKAEMAQVAVVVREYVRAAGGEFAADESWPDVRETAHLLARFAANNHTICDEELRPYGVGIYPVGALVNHSDRPSAVQMFQGKQLVFRALRTIQPGEEVTITYIDLAATAHERREALASQYRFDPYAAAQDPEAPGGRTEGPSLQLQDQPGPSAAAASISPAAAPRTPNPPLLAGEWPADWPGALVMEAQAQLPGIMDSSVTVRAVLHSQPYSSIFVSDEEDANLVLATRAASTSPSGSAAAPDRLYIWGREQEPARPPFSLPGSGMDEEEGAGASTSEQTNRPWPSREGGASEAEIPIVYVHIFTSFSGDPSPVGEGLTPEGQLGLARDYGAALAALRAAERAAAAGRPDEALRVCTGALATVSSIGKGLYSLGPTHILTTRLDSVRLKAAVDVGQFEAAADSSERLVVAYRALYPEKHPALSLQIAQNAKLKVFLGRDPRGALSAAKEAVAAFDVTHPPGGEVRAMGRELLEQAAMMAEELGEASKERSRGSRGTGDGARSQGNSQG